MEFTKRRSIYLALPIAIAAFMFGACAPFSSDGKADRDGKLNNAEIAVWVQSTTDEIGKFRVLFGLTNRATSLELCKIPSSGLPANFVCDNGKDGYIKLAHLTDKSDRKIYIAEKLAVADKQGFAVYAKQGDSLLWDKPREAYFAKKNAGSSGTAVTFTQVKTVMDRACGGSACHGAAQSPRDDFFAGEAAFVARKSKLLTRINSTDDSIKMPRSRSFQGNEKQIMLDYLNRLP